MSIIIPDSMHGLAREAAKAARANRWGPQADQVFERVVPAVTELCERDPMGRSEGFLLLSMGGFTRFLTFAYKHVPAKFVGVLSAWPRGETSGPPVLLGPGTGRPRVAEVHPPGTMVCVHCRAVDPEMERDPINDAFFCGECGRELHLPNG